VAAAEFVAVMRQQFDVLYRESAEILRVMAIALHHFISGVPYRSGAVNGAFEYIKGHDGVWFATGE
jgi:hypothetical protein